MASIPEPREFFLEASLYRGFDVDELTFIRLLRVKHFLETFDAHCIECGREGVFHGTSPPLRGETGQPRTQGPPPEIKVADLLDPAKRFNLPKQTIEELKAAALKDQTFTATFACVRDKSHQLFFFCRVRDKLLSKVGQSPSLRDLAEAGIKKYRKPLGDDRFREFSTAVGLNAHGVGIGAFVYLRRIFESLIEAARREAAKEPGWDEGEYLRSRMDEKIQRLKAGLPGFLVENRHIYSILSKGMHELGEQECLGFFEPLKTGIELILDEEIERRERAEKVARARTALGTIKKQIGGS